MTTIVSIEEATLHLPNLLKRILSGEEEVLIAQEGLPIARLIPIMPIAKEPLQRVFGMDAGKIVLSPDFNDPLPDDIINLFYESKIEPCEP